MRGFKCCLLLFFLVGSAKAAFSQVGFFAAVDDHVQLGFQVHVTIGDPLVSMSSPSMKMQEGILAVLIEILAGNNPSTDPEIQLYPNPFWDDVEIRVKSPRWSLMEAEIYSLSGELVYHFNVPSDITKVPLGGLKTGTYLIRFHGYGIKDFVYKIFKR